MMLSKSIKNLNISDYTDYRVYLKDVYMRLKRFKKPYSYESFNEELGLGKCNAIYLIINGKRPLSKKRCSTWKN